MGRRAILAIVVVLLVFALVLGVFGGITAAVVIRGFPQRDGSARLAGLAADVTVIRDANGIPHIYASTPADLFAAQGWVHASERMWQMEIWRRLGSGRLAELFGESQVDRDRLARTLGWRHAAERDLAALSPDARRMLEAYATGVNAWLEAHPDRPLPFAVLGLTGAGGGLAGFRPEPWTPVDTLTWQKVQAWGLGGNMDAELFNLLLAVKVDPAAVAELSPAYRSDWPVIVPTGARGAGGAGATGRGMSGGSAAASQGGGVGIGQDGVAGPETLAVAGLDAGSAQALARLAGLAGGLVDLDSADPYRASNALDAAGSNNWVVGPSRSASGYPILANDPHLPHGMPSIWFVNGLHCAPVNEGCPYDVAGVSFAGSAGVVLGHNARIAWAFTNVDPDVQDLFVERLDPSDPNRYEYLGSMRAMTLRRETIRVAGGSDVPITVRETVHGPVVSDAIQDLRPAGEGGSDLNGSGVVYALRWTAIAEPDRSAEAVLALDRADDYQAFRDALRLFSAPSQNVVYADVEGHVGYQMPGLVPVRRSGDGTVPAPGWDGGHDWTGYVPFDDLPRLFDPPDGAIVTANNAVVDGACSHFLASDWDAGYRAQRIRELIEAGGRLTPEAMGRIQGDTLVGMAPEVVARLRDAAPRQADGGVVLQRIRDWDGLCMVDSLGCAAFWAFENRLARALFDPRLGDGGAPGDIARLFVGTGRSAEATLALLDQPDSRWWNDPATTNVETMSEVLSSALDAAGGDLRDALGDPARWTWGALHTITFREPTLGTSGVGPLEAAFNRGPYACPGAPFAVNQNAFDVSRAYPDPYTGEPGDGIGVIFTASAGPSYRLAVDMGDLDGARVIITTGESGIPFDSHYDDMIGPWLRNETVPLPFTRSAVDRAADHRLILGP